MLIACRQWWAALIDVVFLLQIGFVILCLLGVLIPLSMTDPHKMIRTDGTKVTTPRHPSWKTEFYFLWIALRTDPSILMLFPLFFASNWFVSLSAPFTHVVIET